VDVTSVVCPLDCSQKLSINQGELMDNPGFYRRIVRKLNFWPTPDQT